jgi:hypothetical protein
VGFLVKPQNQGRRFVSGLTSKPIGRFLMFWPQKLVATVSSGLASKPAATVFVSLASDFFLPVWPQNWRSTSWLSLKTKVVEGFPVWASKPAALVW